MEGADKRNIMDWVAHSGERERFHWNCNIDGQRINTGADSSLSLCVRVGNYISQLPGEEEEEEEDGYLSTGYSSRFYTIGLQLI